MASSRGSCPSCSKPLVYLRWKDDNVIIVVACHDCKAEVHFDLEEMYDKLVNEQCVDYQQMLENFHPTGRPN